MMSTGPSIPNPGFHGQSPPTAFSQSEVNASSAQEQDSPHITTQLHFTSCNYKSYAHTVISK